VSLAATVALMVAFEAADDGHTACAREVATEVWSTEILLAIAQVESRFQRTVVSQVSGGRRHGGQLRVNSSGPYFCGLLQVDVRHSRARCRAYQRPTCDVWARAVDELEVWRTFCGGRTCALAGYNAGTRAARRGTSRYARKVLRLAQRFRSLQRAVELL
jgi:hypothetical protein